MNAPPRRSRKRVACDHSWRRRKRTRCCRTAGGGTEANVQALGGGGVRAFNNTRAERDRLRVDCSRMEVELEAVNDKVAL